MSDKYGTEQDKQYCYPDSGILINQLGITNEADLEAAEVDLTQTRIEQFEPNFNDISFSALCGIHRFLFQDIYRWAGQIRSVDISKGDTRFANMARIEPEANKLFLQLKQENYLHNLSRTQFIARLAHYYCELNIIHPFRDGNGRTQRLMFEIICINVGYEVDWNSIERSEWITANIAAYHGQLGTLAQLFNRAITEIE
jgi:cell filamentation protein